MMLVLSWAAVAVSPGRALAGIVVTRAEGSIAFDFTPPTEPPTPNSRQFIATVPGSDTIDFTEPFSGDTGRVKYDIARPGPDRLSGDVEARINTTGRAEDGQSQFVLEFTSDRPLQYRFTALPLDGAPTFFEATLDHVVANARISALGDVSGTIPHDEGGTFSEFVSTGTLPAGPHTFTIKAAGGSTRSGGASSAGVASFEVKAVPLPPGAWIGLTVFGALAIARALRRGRGLTGQG
jgi:hypothetical protein